MIVETPPPMGWCVGGRMSQWVGSGQINNNLINLDLIEIIQFCLKIMIYGDTPTHGWVCGLLGGLVDESVGSGQMTKNLINFDLIEIIQFCLKIYDLQRYPHPWWMVGRVNQWIKVKSLKI